MNQITALYYNHRKCTHSTHITRRPIEYYDLTVVVKGCLYYVVKGETVPITTGSMILLRPGEYRQRLDSTEQADYISINFTTDMNLSNLPTVTEDAVTDELSHLLMTCDKVFRHSPDAYAEKIAYLIGVILLHLRENVNDSQVHPLALKIKNFILNHYHEDITLSKISGKFHYSPSCCNNVFKKEVCKTIVDYLIEVRIKKAEEKLIYSSIPLRQVADEVGYDDYNYFSRLFRKRTQYTPTQYRALFAQR